MRIIDDFSAYHKGCLSKAIATLMLNPCFHSIVLYRISCFFYRVHIVALAKIIWYLNRVLFNVDLDFRSNIDGGLKIVHGLGIVVGSEVCAGKNLTIYQGVTIGGNLNRKKEINGVLTGQPCIGENVTIYTDEKLFGPIYVPSETKVKAGAIISSDKAFISQEHVI